MVTQWEVPPVTQQSCGNSEKKLPEPEREGNISWKKNCRTRCYTVSMGLWAAEIILWFRMLLNMLYLRRNLKSKGHKSEDQSP